MANSEISPYEALVRRRQRIQRTRIEAEKLVLKTLKAKIGLHKIRKGLLRIEEEIVETFLEINRTFKRVNWKENFVLTTRKRTVKHKIRQARIQETKLKLTLSKYQARLVTVRRNQLRIRQQSDLNNIFNP